jgi:hypothetical protein
MAEASANLTESYTNNNAPSGEKNDSESRQRAMSWLLHEGVGPHVGGFFY